MSAKLQDKAAWEASFLAFMQRQLIDTVGPLPNGTTFSGMTGIVTGSNVGLGYSCAQQLLRLDLSHLIIAVRSQAKGDAAAKQLRDEFPSANIEVSILDMASYRSVQEFVKRCEQLPRLDLAILNAGITGQEFNRAEETKHEMTLQVNYLSTMLLSTLLLPLLKTKRGTDGPAHLTIVGSDTIYWAEWKDPHCASVFAVADDPTSFVAMNAYMVSKTFLLMFVDRMSQIVSPEEVIINVPNPGLCHGTEIGGSTPSLKNKMMGLMARVIGRAPEIGARQYLHGVVAGADTHGSFLSEGQIKP